MIEFINVTKKYGSEQIAVDDVSLVIPKGELVCFIGSSGSGKTTCMRMINRMVSPSSGRILIDGKNIAKENPVDLRRKIGYVIQQIGLMPHMTVYDNILTVPKLLKYPKKKMDEIARRLIKLADLPQSYLSRYPGELSGGQQQRIGVIRALAADQDIILMDEPFGALDPITRGSLQTLIKELQRKMGKTIVFVTHDMDEALALADRIAVMNKGKLLQYADPENILENPASEYVRDFIGEDRIRQAKAYTQKVSELMLRSPISIREDRDSREALKLMREKRVDKLFVTNSDGVLQGQLDIFDLEKAGKRKIFVQDIMSDCFFVDEDTKVREALYSIIELGYTTLPVVDSESRLSGLLTRGSVAENIYDFIWGSGEENIEIKDVLNNTGENND